MPRERFVANGHSRLLLDRDDMRFLGSQSKVEGDFWDAEYLLQELLNLVLSIPVPEPLTGGATVPAYSVGAGEEVETAAKAVEFPAFDSRKISIPPTGCEVGVGRGFGGTPRKGKKKNVKFEKILPEPLEPHRSAIELFWTEKHSQSPRTERSWNFLTKQLEKVLQQHGATVLNELLEEATAQRWKSIKPSYHHSPKSVTISERQHSHQSEPPKGGCYEVFSQQPKFE